jgi:hypothetical protein
MRIGFTSTTNDSGPMGQLLRRGVLDAVEFFDPQTPTRTNATREAKQTALTSRPLCPTPGNRAHEVVTASKEARDPSILRHEAGRMHGNRFDVI